MEYVTTNGEITLENNEYTVWDETYANEIGRYVTFEEAHEALITYVYTL
jgi:hypothetical protein